MKKILCPTDFSAVADNAIAYAAKLSQQVGAELTLFNVQSLLDMTTMEVVRGKAMTIQGVMDRLEKECTEVARVFKISCYPEVEPSISSMIGLIETRARDFDLIVMGSDGASDYYEKTFGSYTYNVIRSSNTPLLIIPPGCGFQAITLVVYAFDYLKDNDLPVKQLLPFINNVKAELAVLDVVKEPHSYEVEEKIKGVQKMLKDSNRDKVTIMFDTIYSDEVADSINSYALRNEADVLALCSHHQSLIQRLFNKSVIKQVAEIASYPVFVFHE